MKKYDVILIGTGAANIIADAAQLAGKKVALIERGAYGGTCLNRGCIPTKILVSAANAVLSIKEAARIGVKAEQVTLDWKTVSRRLQAKLSESPEIKTYYEAFPNVDTFDGTASFTGKKTLSIAMNDGTTEELEGKMIVIGTGGRTNIPKFPGFEDVGYITSESFFTDAFPQRPYKSLIILGGGPIGCEFAHIFDAAGTDVTIVQHNVRLLPKEDADVSTFLLKQFQNRGLHVALNKETLSARIENGEKVVVLEDRGTGEKTEVRGEDPVAARCYAGSASPYYQQKSRQWYVLCHSGHRMNGCGFSLLCRVCRPYGHIFPQFGPVLSITRYYAIPYVREPVFHSATYRHDRWWLTRKWQRQCRYPNISHQGPFLHFQSK